jgi:hypothetical protein
MKQLYAIISFLILTSSVVAQQQPYGNEWINFSTNQPYSNQQYFRIKVWKDGMYRITYSDLVAAAFPMPFNPKQLQLFHLGEEQFIHVEGEADGSFDVNDYIEFFGKKNDSELDQRLYKNPDHVPNKKLSLFSDTTAYFLTINSNPFIVNKRMGFETDLNFIGYTPAPFLMKESYVSWMDEYVAFKLIDILDSEYDEGEGWYRGPISSAPVTVQLPVPNLSNDPNAPLLQIATATMGGNNTGNTHTISVSSHGASASNNFIGFGISKFDFPISSNSAVTGGNASVVFTPGTGVVNRTHISYVKATYPHSLSFSGEASNFNEFTVPGNAASKSYLPLTNIALQDPKLYLFSGDTLKKVSMAGSGSGRQLLVPTFGIDKKVFLTDTVYTSALGLISIEPVRQDPANYARFTNFQYINQADYLIVTNKRLWSKANDYKNYRSLTGFTPLLADVEELYDQFAYGFAQHPLSIKNFSRFTLDQFTLKPEYLFLIGKSVSPLRTRMTFTTNQNSINTIRNNWNTNLVPTFGYPSSDVLFAAGINDSLPRIKIAVGRISASSPDDVQAYLDKMMSHEAQLQQCPQDWMKEILHFGGGNNGFESEYIKTILAGFENIARDTLLGANVTSYYKTTSDPIQVNLTQQLQARIDSGTTMMTFVAHASGTTFDINTDIPQNYNNKDRYPLIIANSCLVGDIHEPNRRIVEDFVLLPEKGAIAFIAQPGVGYLGNLQSYTTQLYSQIAKHNYNGSLGNSMINVVDSLLADPLITSSSSVYFFFKSLMTGMTLSGDPALVMHSWDRPDYTVNSSSIFFTPQIITSNLDSFDVNVVVTNLGRATGDPVTLHLVRRFPGGQATFELDTLISYVPYKDTISIRLPLDAIRGVGVNYFDVTVDYFSNIDECNEANNSVTNIPLLIQSSDIVPVYPKEFSIVPVSSISLKGSTANPFASVKPYKFQIDTVDNFSSPFLQQTIISSAGGVVQWQLPFTLQTDLVYYWRVSRDSMAGDTIHPLWRESSFIHKSGITGWSQAHYSQFKQDDYVNVIYNNAVTNTFEFVQTTTSLTVTNYKNPAFQVRDPSIEVNNVIEDYNMCGGAPSIHLFVLDSVSIKLWDTNKFIGQANYYNGTSWTCRQRPEKYFVFRDTPAGRAALLTAMTDSVPAGNYIGIYSIFNLQYSQWDPALKQLLTSWGSDSVNFLQDGDPYIFFTKKGDNSYTQEVLGDSIRTDIVLNASLGGNWKKGFISSVTIGPATQWTSLHWDQFPLEATGGLDSMAIDVIGITPGGLEEPVGGFTGIQVGNYDVNISAINATQYPRLKLRAYLQDEGLFTPPQLKRWQIYYDEIPELALNPARYFKLSSDTVAEGDKITMEMAVENIGNVNTDSVLVDFYIFDRNRVRHNISSPRYKTTAPGDTIIAIVNVNTGGYPGLNSLWIEANPNFDQPEQTLFNNLAEIKFQVDRDITNPLLDVTFDGVHIMNGDIVSGKPEIQIRLKDENKFLALNDTTNWQVFLRNPSGSQTKLSFESIACSGVATEQMKWCPANLPDNTFRITYKPTLLADGIYELWVQASDKSGNLSGENNYRITFEVINKSTITEVVNYPNPFSTATKFVFTLTGSEVPDYFKIQIMTVTGKIVREITRDELGPIRIGRNITDYAWNGKDEFGDQLANGVYLYRVITRMNGSSIEKRETEADKFFTKGWGKMYLMR